MHLLYFHDALCGWCYGFSPVLKSFAAEHADAVTLEVIAGGMITGGRIGPIGEVAPYIKTAYRDVEIRTGVTFGEGFLRGVLDEGSTIFTSVPPAVALAAVKALAPEQQLAFADAVQTAIYYTGIDPSDGAAYTQLATKLGIDAERFAATYAAPATLAAAQADFERSRAYGVTGFPTLVLQKEDQAVVIARGYLGEDTLVRNFRGAVEALG